MSLEPLFYILVFIFSVVIHEVSHGAMANSLGDPTAKNLGRLSLNPLVHLDMFGSVILPIMLALISGFNYIIGYAKPVPYDPSLLRDRRYGPAKVAIAGPLSNLILAMAFGFLLRFIPDVFSSSLVPDLLSYIVRINLILAIFNLMPIPPLDGQWLLMTFLPSKYDAVKVFLYKYSLVLLFLFIFFIFPFLVPLVAMLFKLITGLGF